VLTSAVTKAHLFYHFVISSATKYDKIGSLARMENFGNMPKMSKYFVQSYWLSWNGAGSRKEDPAGIPWMSIYRFCSVLEATLSGVRERYIQ
jgi:hypothetical protein